MYSYDAADRIVGLRTLNNSGTELNRIRYTYDSLRRLSNYSYHHSESISARRIFSEVEMGLFDWLKKKPVHEKKKIDVEKLDRIAEFVKENYKKDVIRIIPERVNSTGLTESKFGGLPYWEKDKAPVTSRAGDPLYLLAQINFEKERLKHPLLPSKGILQFFIQADDLYGLNLKEPTNQDTFRVVYHPTIDPVVTVEDVVKTGMTANTQLDPEKDSFPFFAEYRLRFETDTDSVGYSAEKEYDEALSKAIYILFGEEMQETAHWYFSSEEYDYLASKLGPWGHKMFGYPNFTQSDPRNARSEKPKDILLFQIDSDVKEIQWGDRGVANFFISREDLQKKNFSNVLYNWDCY